MNELGGETRKKNGAGLKGSAGEMIRCIHCAHFAYFGNKAGHNSAHALGKCLVESWDGNKGQWPMFPHHCKDFLRSQKKDRSEENIEFKESPDTL